MVDDGKGHLWYSTGRTICRLQTDPPQAEDTVLQLPDVSALAFTPDGKLWMATIYGKLYRYEQGEVFADDYASNEFGDAVTALATDSMGRLVMVSDRYVRLYDTRRRTLRQQSREPGDCYQIELAETAAEARWSSPAGRPDQQHVGAGDLPWWIWGILSFLLVGIVTLLAVSYRLKRQRDLFLAQIKDTVVPSAVQTASSPSTDPPKPEQPEWLQKAMSCVETHLSDENYGVEQLSSDLCMSRMTFYRKLQSAVGQKPTEFIRTIRLRHAAMLLREGRLSVTEISYATGFSSVSYFSRSFRTMFGVSPTQFLEMPRGAADLGKNMTADSLSPNDSPSSL